MMLNYELIPADTTMEAYLVQMAALRRLSPDRRLEMVCELNDSLREVMASGVRARHPEYSPQQVNLALARLRLGDELFRKVYPGVDLAP